MNSQNFQYCGTMVRSSVRKREEAPKPAACAAAGNGLDEYGFAVRTICLLLLTLFVFFVLCNRSFAGSFGFAKNNPNAVTHPAGYDGSGEELTVTVGIDPNSAHRQDMVVAVQNIVKAYNELIPVLENIVFSGQSGVPYNYYDFESVAIHEIGHALGMGHPNIGGSPASDPRTEFTESTEGSNGVFDRNAGADGIPGSDDDLRGDDINLCYFRIDNNDPFEIASIVDSTTYSRDVSDLPSGHNFPAHSNRDLWESINGIDNGESVMQQGTMAGEAHRQLGPEDVATLLYAMSGFDEREGTSDDYTFTLVYAGFTADADIVIDFDSSKTGFAVTQINALVWGDHYVLTQCNIYFNDSHSWFFNDELANYEPEILDQYYVCTPEETPVAIRLSDLVVQDLDNDYPDDFGLSVQNGSNYARSGNTITPNEGFTGVLYAPVTVNDGFVDSAPFNVAVHVIEVNDPPVITGQATLCTDEDTAIDIDLNDLTVSDPDDPYPAGFTLSIAPGSNYTRSGNTVVPAANFSGALHVPATVNDGTDDSPVYNLQVEVLPVNDPPAIVGQEDLAAQIDTSLTIHSTDLKVFDPDNSYPSGFTLTVLGGSNCTVDGATVTPNQGFQGILNVGVKTNDGQLDSNTYQLKIYVSEFVYVSHGECGKSPAPCYHSIDAGIDEHGFSFATVKVVGNDNYDENVVLDKNYRLELGLDAAYETPAASAAQIGDSVSGAKMTVSKGVSIIWNVVLGP